MFTRTQNGYALGSWEGVPMALESGWKITRGEVRAAVCRANGMTAKEAAKELNCSPGCVSQYMQSIYFKLNCAADAVVAITELVDIGALKRLSMVLLLVSVTGSALDGNTGEINTNRIRYGGRINVARLVQTARVSGSV